MTASAHARRIAALMIAAAALLGWQARRADVMFNDGIRYLTQAQRLDAGAWRDGVSKSVDHPLYPLAVAAAHRVVGGEDPASWVRAGQVASVAAGVLWVIPIYLIAVELHGAAFAWLAVLLALLVPVTGHVFGDVLSESTFLLFWCWGVWSALRFLRRGAFVWLPITVLFAGLSYLTRPEGLLLPAALIGTLGLMPLLRSTRMNWPRWWWAVGFLVLTPLAIVGPYVALKGGLGTKPAIARVLGTAPKAAPGAVERARPLDPDMTGTRLYLNACREVAAAIKDGVTWPILPFALVGLAFAWPPGERSRAWLFMFVMFAGALPALVRLQATGGYCTSRHAMILIYPIVTVAAFGLHSLIERIRIPGRLLGQGDAAFEPGPLVWVGIAAAYAAIEARPILEPINHANAGYLQAAGWLAEHSSREDRAVDLPGLSLFHADRQGYTFENLHVAPGDPRVKWVVVREAHLLGAWPYCESVRAIVKDRRPVASFPAAPDRGQSKVLVFDLSQTPTDVARAPETHR